MGGWVKHSLAKPTAYESCPRLLKSGTSVSMQSCAWARRSCMLSDLNSKVASLPGVRQPTSLMTSPKGRCCTDSHTFCSVVFLNPVDSAKEHIFLEFTWRCRVPQFSWQPKICSMDGSRLQSWLTSHLQICCMCSKLEMQLCSQGTSGLASWCAPSPGNT